MLPCTRKKLKRNPSFVIFFKKPILFVRHLNRKINLEQKSEVFLEKKKRLKIVSNHTQVLQSDLRILYHMFIFSIYFILFYFLSHITCINFNFSLSIKLVVFYLMYILHVLVLFIFILICFLINSCL